jgi:hypothetical protein
MLPFQENIENSLRIHIFKEKPTERRNGGLVSENVGYVLKRIYALLLFRIDNSLKGYQISNP